MSEAKTVVRIKGGRLEAIYDDVLAPLVSDHGAEIRTASRVVPDAERRHGGNWKIVWEPWVFGAPREEFCDKLGRPFLTRQAALDYEVGTLDLFLSGSDA